MSDGPTGDVALSLDTRGLLCPIPIIELAKRIKDVDIGAVVEVLSDDPAARADIPAWCRMRSHDYLGERPADNATAYLIRRSE